MFKFFLILNFSAPGVALQTDVASPENGAQDDAAAVVFADMMRNRRRELMDADADWLEGVLQDGLLNPNHVFQSNEELGQELSLTALDMLAQLGIQECRIKRGVARPVNQVQNRMIESKMFT